MSVKPQSAARVKKKTQTFVLRVWERSEGTRYELRTLAGERKTFKTLEDIRADFIKVDRLNISTMWL
jgi:hypothetical protein